MSYNVQIGRELFDKNDIAEKKNLDAFYDLISNQIDILCLQEISPRLSQWISEHSDYPHSVQAAKKGTLLLSKYEVTDFGEIDFGTRQNSCIWADLNIQGQIVRIYNVHLQSSRISADAEKVIVESNEYSSKFFTDIQSILSKYTKFNRIRVGQAKQLKDHSNSCPYPFIIAGDFNEAPVSYVYNLLSDNMTDSFSCGNGLGNSYPQTKPLIRIDYILLSKKMRCNNFEILRNISLSDHIPIISTFKIEN